MKIRTVGELRHILSHLPDDAPVVVERAGSFYFHPYICCRFPLIVGASYIQDADLLDAARGLAVTGLVINPWGPNNDSEGPKEAVSGYVSPHTSIH